MKTRLLATAVAMVAVSVAFAQNDSMMKSGRIGRMSVAAFNAINKAGGKNVAAIKPSSTPLSEADQELFKQVAEGGQRQLAISQAVVDRATDPRVKMLAASEVEEQTGLSAKLQEMATAKGLNLPAGPPPEAQALVEKAQSLSGTELDAFYLTESGIKGHELLQATMQKVSKMAKDAGMKKLAVVTLPVIRTHLAVSKDLKTMSKTSTASL